MKLTRVLLATAFAGLASCSDSNTPNGAASGTVSFTFTGGGGGSYNVTGAIPVNQASLYTTAWAAGERIDANGTVEVLSIRPQTSGTFDEVYIGIPRTTAGNSTIDVNCSAAACAEVLFLIGTNVSGTQFQFLCTLEAGTVTIASISSSRVSGSFGGTGTCDNGTSLQAFTVTGGSFDVPLLSDASL